MFCCTEWKCRKQELETQFHMCKKSYSYIRTDVSKRWRYEVLDRFSTSFSRTLERQSFLALVHVPYPQQWGNTVHLLFRVTGSFIYHSWNGGVILHLPLYMWQSSNYCLVDATKSIPLPNSQCCSGKYYTAFTPNFPSYLDASQCSSIIFFLRKISELGQPTPKESTWRNIYLFIVWQSYTQHILQICRPTELYF